MSQAKKIPSPLTPEKLRRIALRYLDRFATSRVHLERVLMRHVQKSHYHHQTDLDAAQSWLTILLHSLEESGLLNDHAYAEGRAAALHRKGTSKSHIRLKLKEKGLADPVIEQALDQLESENIDLEAAQNYARRRRFGPYRDPQKRAEHKEKDMAAMIRAGFSYDIARQVIENEDILES